LRRRDEDYGVGPVVRLLRGRGGEALAALLAYLPYAPCEEIEEDVYRAAYACVGPDAATTPALSAAVRDFRWQRRALAGWMLARRKGKRERLLAARLLGDESAEVRLRVAQGFLAAADVRAVPALIDLLGAEWRVAVQAEELLLWGLGDRGPSRGAIKSGAAKERAKAWRKWWEEAGADLCLEGIRRQCPSPRLVLFGVRESTKGGDVHSVRLAGSGGMAEELLRTTRALSDPLLLPSGAVVVREGNGLALFARGGKEICRKQIEIDVLDVKVVANGRIRVLVISARGYSLLTLGEAGAEEEKETVKAAELITDGWITPSGAVRLLVSTRRRESEWREYAGADRFVGLWSGAASEAPFWVDETHALTRRPPQRLVAVTGATTGQWLVGGGPVVRALRFGESALLLGRTGPRSFVLEERSATGQLAWESPGSGN
jgi:hypothetical protein